jgi:hypothetical protein
MNTFLSEVASGLSTMQSDFDYEYTTTSAGSDAAGALFGTLGLGVICISVIIGLAALAFNVWMIVDVAKREFEQKTLWLVLLIAGLVLGFGFIVALVYFFAVRAPMEKAGMTASSTSAITGKPGKTL